MKFKEGDRFKVTRLFGPNKGKSWIETIIEVNSSWYKITSSIEAGIFSSSDISYITNHRYAIKRINHYNTKPGRILYKT